MPKIDGLTRTQRLERVWMKVRSAPHGIKESEIADELGMERRTVNNYLRELVIEGRIIKDKRLWYPAPWQETRLRPFELTPEEALTLYLGARLLSKQYDKRNEPAETALLKLAQALRDDAGVGREIEQAARELSQRPAREGYQSVFRTVVRGYIYRRRLRLRYKPLNQKNAFETTFAPYLIEPSLVGSAIYVIGHSSIVNDLRAYKLGRIQQAELTHQEYDIPADFPGLDILRNAWSIISGEETLQIALRFSPRVRERVLETIWHPSEQKEEDPEKTGWLRWTAQLAHTQDIIPWIRSWGADCEVVGPSKLKRTMRREARKLSNLYLGAPEENMPSAYALWAKTDPANGTYHPLLFHLIDTAECALALWKHAFTPGIRRSLAQSLNLTEAETRRLFAFLAALHDLGKASPAYQCKYPPDDDALQHLETLGFHFPAQICQRPAPHGLISAWALRALFTEVLGWKKYDARRLAHAVGGHHGTWPATLEVQNLDGKYRSHPGDGLWKTTRREIFTILQEIYQPPSKVVLPDAPEQSALLAILSGLVTTADWLGSLDEYFEYEDRPLSAQKYRPIAARQAARALKATGWADTWLPTGEVPPFAEVFPFSPNEMQTAVIQAALDAEQPTLLILEAPTGQGKTEAALYLADAWLQQRGGRGLYIAMPTQATSNQMFERTLNFLNKRYPGERINVHLTHGQARWHEAMENLRLSAVGDDAEDGLRAEAWFLPRKRTLLAPFGVGTVDQALMGVLQTRHAFLRLFGLAHKVVIFDEVHAYDTYMEEIFLRLLAWLRAVGTSVIVLSATLPENTRRQMAQAFGGSLPGQTAPYPRLTLVSSEDAQIHPLPVPPQRAIALEWLDRQPESIAAALHARLQNGGCAAVICNTVRRAQEIYQALAADAALADTDLTLFHARMPHAWRKEVEDEVLTKFGKPDETSSRPHKAVVVATQVIEQSLDLDFDLMISDLAPIDLLIQRAGRLHRHPRGARPPGLEQPRLLIAQPDGEITSPSFGSDAFVYERYILWQTWRTLQGRASLRLPGETDALIQAVYGDLDPENIPVPLRAALQQAYANMQKHFHDDGAKARNTLLPAPTDESLVTRPGRDLRDDEDPKLHPQIRARTRLIAPGVKILCLHRQPDGSLTLEPDGSGRRISLDRQPYGKEVEDILHYSLTIHDARLVRRLADAPAPWKKTAALRYLYPLVFEDGVCHDFQEDGLLLHLDRTLGFRIEKEA